MDSPNPDPVITQAEDINVAVPDESKTEDDTGMETKVDEAVDAHRRTSCDAKKSFHCWQGAPSALLRISKTEQKTVDKAINGTSHHLQKTVMDRRIHALVENKVRTMVTRTTNKNTISCKRISKVEEGQQPDGSLRILKNGQT